MNVFALAKLIGSVDRVASRKKLQKLVYLTQSRGYELGARYSLHHYGPYSWDVAETVDALVREGIIAEQEQKKDDRSSYAYTLTQEGSDRLRLLEDEGHGGGEDQSNMLELFGQLNNKSSRVLELGATTAFFRRSGDSLNVAKERTSAFKRVDESDPKMAEGAELAEKILSGGGGS